MEENLKIPAHVALILDGNGRWAKKRGLPRQLGHKKGCETLEQVVEDAARLGIRYLTVYGFSTENWKNTGMTFVIAVNYGSRDEITRAVRKIMTDVEKGKIAPEDMTEKVFASYLDTAGIPDPDLMIRTSGELRLSNYLLWQLAYSELYVTECLWPDFNKEELLNAIRQYNKRERRFGGVTAVKTEEEGILCLRQD